ncbi:MAG: hypothetical protein QRY72_05145 [Candidatus Rhabdochlamydia sp.]
MRLTFSQIVTTFTYLSWVRSLPEHADIPSHYVTAQLFKQGSSQEQIPSDLDTLLPRLYHNAKSMVGHIAQKPLIHLAFKIETVIRSRLDTAALEPLVEENRLALEQLNEEYTHQLKQFAPLIHLMNELQKAASQTTNRLLFETILLTPVHEVQQTLLLPSCDEMSHSLLLVKTTVEQIFQAPKTADRIKRNVKRLEEGKQTLALLEIELASITKTLSAQVDQLQNLLREAQEMNELKSSSLLTLQQDASSYLVAVSCSLQHPSYR